MRNKIAILVPDNDYHSLFLTIGQLMQPHNYFWRDAQKGEILAFLRELIPIAYRLQKAECGLSYEYEISKITGDISAYADSIVDKCKIYFDEEVDNIFDHTQAQHRPYELYLVLTHIAHDKSTHFCVAQC